MKKNDAALKTKKIMDSLEKKTKKFIKPINKGIKKIGMENIHT